MNEPTPEQPEIQPHAEAQDWKIQRKNGRRRAKARLRLERIYDIRRRRRAVVFSRIGFAVWGIVAVFLIVKDCT